MAKKDNKNEDQQASEKKNALALLEHPMMIEDPTPVTPDETPFQQTYQVLTVTHGATLEIMARTNMKLMRAVVSSYNLVANYGSAYIRGLCDTMLRLSISSEGKGRDEMVKALTAGSGVSDGFYNQENGPGGFSGGYAEEGEE